MNRMSLTKTTTTENKHLIILAWSNSIMDNKRWLDQIELSVSVIMSEVNMASKLK